MKRTLFLSTLIAGLMAVMAPVSALTITGTEGTYQYNGDDYIRVDLACNTNTLSETKVTFNLAKAVDFIKSSTNTNASNCAYLLGWSTNLGKYGLSLAADGEGVKIQAMNGNGVYGQTSIAYSTLTDIADKDGNVTLTVTSTKNAGVTATYSGGSTTWSGLQWSKTTHIGSYRTEDEFVTAIELQTTGSTLTTPEAFEKADPNARSLGRTLFVGDSITHGVSDATWRWQLFKTLTDNGIENEINGPRTGNNAASVTSDASSSNTAVASHEYGGATFENVHLAQASGRVRNLLDGYTTYNNYEGNLTAGSSDGASYDGHTAFGTTHSTNYDTVICMIGTNDLLSDQKLDVESMSMKMQGLLGGTITHDSTNGYQWSREEGESWGNMGQLVSDLMTEKQEDTLYLMTIPAWTLDDGCNDNPEHLAVKQYNEQYEKWVNAYNKAHNTSIKLIDINEGLVDKTRGTTFYAHEDFFKAPGTDGLHPNEQGSLIIAGNLAKGMELAGRTGGLMRANAGTAGTNWTTVSDIGEMAAGDSHTIASNIFTIDEGYTIDFNANFGDGETNGWLDETNGLSIVIGDGVNTGTLTLTEGYIMWEDSVLYCQDNSVLNENLRIAWHNGNAAENVQEGYYVWLGDMLIGQGLESGENKINGITLSSTGGNSSIYNLSYSDTAYAPTTSGDYNADSVYLTRQDAGYTGIVDPSLLTSAPSGYHTATSNTLDPGYFAGISGTAITGTKTLIANDSSITSSQKFLLNTTGNNIIKAYVAMLDKKDFTGDVAVKLTGKINASILGAMGNANKAGNLTVEIAEGAYIGTAGTYSGTTGAIAGSYGGGNAQSFNVYVNGGTIEGDIVGGSINGKGTIGKASIIVNGGTINADILGGSKIAGATVGESYIEVNGGTINGDIITTGTAGNLNKTDVVINGGVIKGNIGEHKDMAATETSITVVGNKASIQGRMQADKVTLKDIVASGYADSIDNYKRTITTDQLVLDNVQTHLTAIVNVQDIAIINASNTSLIMGDTATLSNLELEANVTFAAYKSAEALLNETGYETTLIVTRLTAAEGVTLNANLVFSDSSSLCLTGGTIAMGSSVSLAEGMSLTLSDAMLQNLYAGQSVALFTGVDELSIGTQALGNGTSYDATSLFTGLDSTYSYTMSYQNGTVSLSTIPEPATATLSLAALMMLCARRRRTR